MTDEQRQISDIDRRVNAIESKMDAFIQSNEEFKKETRRANAEFRNDMRNAMQDFKNEMRQQNEMRANEIMELRQDLRDTSKEIRTLLLTFVGIVVAILIGMFWTH